MADRLKLAEGEVLRGIYRPNDHGPVSPYPDGVEQFPSVRAAEDALYSRTRTQESPVYYIGEEPTWGQWPDADRTGYLDVWVARPDPDEDPADVIPGDYDQRWHSHTNGGTRRENF